MSGRNSDEIVIGADGDIFLAPALTDVEPDPDVALGSAFLKMGYATPEGVAINDNPTIGGVPAWQSPKDVRKFVQTRIDRLAFQLLQWTDASFVLAFGGGEWVEEESGLWRYDPPAQTDSIPEHTLVVDWSDGDRKWRLAHHRTNVVEGVSANIVRTGAAPLPVTVEALEVDDGPDWNIWTNDPAFDPAAS